MIRELKIKNLSADEERTVIHYNYLTWQDFGVPDEPEFEVLDDLINRITKIDSNEKDKSKIIVHCSAGIGRTGTLIALYLSLIHI